MEKRKKPAKAKLDLRRSPQFRGIRWHQDQLFDPLRFTVLTASQLSDSDKETIRATMLMTVSGPEAMTLPGKGNYWACEQISNGYRQTLVLKFKGIEVALFYKRQLTVIEPQSESPGYHPEGVLQDPVEAWQRLDLLGPSAKKQNSVLKSLHDRLAEENRLLAARVESLDAIASISDTNIVGLQKQVEGLQTRIKALTTPKPPVTAQTTGKTRQNAKSKRPAPRINRKKRGKR